MNWFYNEHIIKTQGLLGVKSSATLDLVDFNPFMLYT